MAKGAGNSLGRKSKRLQLKQSAKKTIPEKATRQITFVVRTHLCCLCDFKTCIKETMRLHHEHVHSVDPPIPQKNAAFTCNDCKKVFKNKYEVFVHQEEEAEREERWYIDEIQKEAEELKRNQRGK